MSSKSDIVRRRTLSPEALRFADLVRAREIQQEKLRDALLHQNSDLRRKLEETSPPRQNSTDPNVTPLRHEDASPAPAAQSTGSGDRGSAASAAATSVAGHVNAGVALDYAYLIQTMRDMIAKSQDAQLTALAQHEAAIAHRFEAMQRSVDDLHEAMHRDETQRAILREEQTQQYLELSAEVDKLREDLTRRGSDDIVKKEVAANLLAVEADLSRMSARISAIEELPRHFRDEFASMEERFASLSATIASDRNAAIQARNDVAERHELEVQAILKNAEDTLARVVSAASSCELQAADAQASLGIKVQESVSRLAESLEAEILARMEEQAEKVSQVAQRQAMEFQSMQVEIHNSLGEVKASVESSLLGMRRQYHDAVQEQLRSVVQQAEEFERQRRAECPVADSDRVDLMVAELQGAAVMLEGILANAASQQRHDPKIPGRIDGLEAKLAGLEARLEHIADPSSSGEPLRICVTVPVQTEGEFKSGGGASEVTPSVEEKVTHRVQRHLADELDKAADEIRLASARKVLARLTASPPATSRAMVESHAAAAPQPTPTLALTQSQSLPRYPQAVSARGASTHDYESLSLEEVRQKLASKEAALVKVQTILRNILATFHAVSEQEELHGDSWSKEKIEEVIRQKHEMYTRERQLVDQRNVLMKDIAELQSVERRLSLN